MAKFKYKFNTIKLIKERLEKKAQKELAQIDLEINKKQKETNEVKKLLRLSKISKTDEKPKNTDELHFFEKYESYLAEQISILEKYINEKMSERKEKVKELVQKSKETKTFSKLEEKHLEEFTELENKNDQKEMDEIAIQEFMKE